LMIHALPEVDHWDVWGGGVTNFSYDLSVGSCNMRYGTPCLCNGGANLVARRDSRSARRRWPFYGHVRATALGVGGEWGPRPPPRERRHSPPGTLQPCRIRALIILRGVGLVGVGEHGVGLLHLLLLSREGHSAKHPAGSPLHWQNHCDGKAEERFSACELRRMAPLRPESRQKEFR